MFDVLADVLEQVRLAGTVYFSAELRAPWGVGVRPEGRAPFYVVTAGSCLLEVDGEPAPRTLAAGDLALLPRARPHVLRSGAEVPTILVWSVREGASDGRAGIGALRRRPGPDLHARRRLLPIRGAGSDPLLSALPAVVHLRADDRQVASLSLPPTLRFIGVEMGDYGLHGSRSVLNRLADILFIQAVRAFLSMGEPIHAGWLKGLSDGQVARVLALIHQHYAKPWSLERLAPEIGISRTVLAVRFRTLVGASRMAYLHAMANAPGRAAAARVTRGDGGGCGEGRVHVVRGRVREGIQADARADAGGGSAVGLAALSDHPNPQSRAGVSMSLRLRR